ncbi:amidohydrolase family protein [Vallitalea sp.]|jgi:dihydropyrimidinase|uniref:amidohydrolase family protein n=1 Tax=Vallitalea sp. TaxID=1882829 RepID=UPI0025D275D8|nr:amidohydrolase family protein [Vallitalea sp.]MCT4688410.1 amidohydrolase family protein [Vallitalea sp.]
MYDLGIINGNLYIDGKYEKLNLYITNEKIAKISNETYECKESYDVENKKVFPGFIDPHVHFELNVGKYTSCDDFYTGSVSAAYGGITTIIDFLDPIATGIEVEKALNTRKKLAEKSVIDYSFHVTIRNPIDEIDNIVDEMRRLQIPTVKLFTTYSESDRRTYDKEITKLLGLTKENNILVLAHIENDNLIDRNPVFEVKDLPKSRCSESELKEALKLASFTKHFNGRLYMVHLSSGNTIKALAKHYPDLLNKDFFVESCPHYFNFTSNVYSEEKGFLYVMAPPLRTENERELLRANFDYINTIGTDHCPFTSKEKNKDKLLDVPMGIGSVEHSFNIMYNIYKDKVIDKITIGPAKIHGLYPKKGILAVGSDADIVIYDPLATYIIGEDHSTCDYNIYAGNKINGRIESTISKGKFIIKNNEFIGGKGKYLTRKILY